MHRYSINSLPGFKDVIITHTETRNHQYIMHFEMQLKPHVCPASEQETQKVHDYRVTKMKHLKMMERITLLFYRKRRYMLVESCLPRKTLLYRVINAIQENGIR